ncbi:hypothetical protein [Flintibacter porci]|uniref:hypothetical protein n=1 Tax=Flintibacter porci TaxID=3342383 RepID=UPI003F8B494D
MGRVEQFEHQNKICYRKELEGYPVEVIVKHRTEIYNGKEISVELRDWRGRHCLILGEEILDVDRSFTTDRGPKLGVALGMEKHREVPFTEEEKAEGRKRVIEVATQLMIRAGIW